MGKKRKGNKPARKPAAGNKRGFPLKFAAALMLMGIMALVMLGGIGVWFQATARHDAPQKTAEPSAPEASDGNPAVSAHQPKPELMDFYNQHLKKMLQDELLAGRYPIKEIADYYSELMTAINRRYGKEMLGNLSDKYGSGNALFGYSAEDDEPQAYVIMPALKDLYADLEKTDPASAQALLESTAVFHYIQILQSLADNPGKNLTAAEKEAFEVKLWDASLRRVIAPMLSSGVQITPQIRETYNQWLACGQNPDDPAWHRHIQKLIWQCQSSWSRQDTQKAYGDDELEEFWKKRLAPVIESVKKGGYAVPEINTWFDKLNRHLIDEFGTGVKFTAVLSYIPQTKIVPMASTAEGDKPEIVLLVPAYIDYEKKMRQQGFGNIEGRMNNSLAAGIIHEMWHLNLDWPQTGNPTFDEYVDSEKLVWAQTMENIICPLIEKYHLPLERSDEIYYEHWIKGGRSQDSPEWDSFIRDLYRGGGR